MKIFANEGYCIAHMDGSREKIYKTPDDVLEYTVGDDRLRDILKKMPM
ncbi:MAG: hypothetical protein Q4F81_06980 [Eubacteriales bacterium]|nr:hypothetical protein [Eubacteriales bacterium]